MDVALFLVGSAAMLAGSALTATLLGLRHPLEWTLATMVIGCAEIVVVSLVAGVLFHSYRPASLVGLVCGYTLVLAAAVIRKGGRVHFPLRRLHLLPPGSWSASLPLVAAAALLWRLLLAVVLPPFAYDALTYHLTAVASWVQSRRIGSNPYALCCGHYPSDAEVLFGWPTVLLHDDVLTQSVQIGLAVLAALAVAGLARASGVTARGAAVAAALFVLTPIVLTQANVNYNDVAVVAFLLAAMFFGDRFVAERRPAHLLLAGVSLGLLLGTKLDAPIMVGIVAATTSLRLALAPPLAVRSVPAAALVAAPVVLLGGWWYGRNWVTEGNPFWPVRVDGVFGGLFSRASYLTIPPGGSRNVVVEVARSWYHDLVFWTRRDYSYEEREGGLGPLWSWVGWWAAATVALGSIREHRLSGTFVAGLAVPLVLIFAIEPYRWWSRFTIYLAALGAIAIVLLLERGRGRGHDAAALAVAALACAGAVRATWWLAPASRAPDLPLPSVVGLALHPSRPRTAGALFFPEYRWLDRVPRRATIAVETNSDAIRFIYPLFGRHLDRRVVQLLEPDPQALDARLQRDRVTYLFVGAGDAYARWAHGRPGYRLDFRGAGVAVYRRSR